MKLASRIPSSISGIIIGGSAFVAAFALDALDSAVAPPNPVNWILSFVFASIAWALVTSSTARAALTSESGARGSIQRTASVSAFAITLFLVPAFVIDPSISPRALLYFYALGMVLIGLAEATLLEPPAKPQGRAARLADYFDSTPHAPFVLAALFLLVLTPIALLVNQPGIAERWANWAFGFLVAGVALALVQFLDVPLRRKEWLRSKTQWALAFYVALVSVAGYLIGMMTHTRTEGTFIIDVNPNYVSETFRDGDILLSDSPKLRLSTIPMVGAYLDVAPDSRGLALWDDLARALAGKKRVLWLSDGEQPRDRQRILETFLKANGCLDEIPITPLPIRVYELREPFTRPRVLPPALAAQIPDAFDARPADFGAIQIIGARVEPRVCSHDAAAVALRWKLAQPLNAPLKVSLRLLDDKGRQIQSQDSFIEDGAQRKTNAWNTNAQNDAYYLVAVPLGTAPGNYTIAASVYPEGAGRLRAGGADSIALGQVEVYRADAHQADPYQTDQDAALVAVRAEVRTGLRLNAYGVSATTVLPGENLRVRLRWRAQLDALPAYQVQTRLVQGERVIAQASGAPVDNSYPTNLWRAGEYVTDYWDLRVPPETLGGKARVEVEVEGGRALYLADVTIPDIKHSFQAPAPKNAHRAAFDGIGELVGHDLDRAQVAANDALALTLYWRATAPVEKNYVVFAQLLTPDGQVIAQSDRAPAQGARPTRGWVSGEYIADTHALNLNDTPYRGDATLIVGIYDPTTLERVPVKDTANNFVRLPATVRVIAP